jgi:hypothetical protein
LVDAVGSLARERPYMSMVSEDPPRESWTVAIEHERQTPNFAQSSPSPAPATWLRIRRATDRRELAAMELQHERCAGMDISKGDVKVCVRTPGKRHRTFDKNITVWGATAGEVGSLTKFLVSEQVTLVVMEATGSYWKPFYYPMESELNVMLVNARHARNLPGRKTDLSPTPSG